MRRNTTHHLGEKSTTIRFTAPEEILADRNAAAGLVVADENTRAYTNVPDHDLVVLPPGESSKSWLSIESICRRALNRGMARDGRFYGVGGGVVCDITAFAASIYLRGVSLTLVPTTLLAMVDAAFGGKTGVDFQGYKNILGTFYPASHVLIAPAFLTSLSEREYQSGLAEVIKSGMLGDPVLLELLEARRAGVLRREPEVMEEIVARSLAVKAAVVEQDLRESGIRAHLNLGHTFGHALEAVTQYAAYTHGEAVAWGMACALRAGRAVGITNEAYAERSNRLLKAYGYPLTGVQADANAIIDAMQRDKKKAGGTVRFVLQRNLAETVVMPLDETLVRQAIEPGLAT
jgi:3-dehydroquinate synthase